MTRILVFLLSIVLLTAPANKSLGQDFEYLFRDFDSRTLSYEDKRFLQTAQQDRANLRGADGHAQALLFERATDRAG